MKSSFKCSVEPKHETSFQGTRQNTNTPEGTFFPNIFQHHLCLLYQGVITVYYQLKKRHIKVLLEGKSLKTSIHVPCFIAPQMGNDPILGLCKVLRVQEHLEVQVSLGKSAPGCTSGNGWHIPFKGMVAETDFPG